ncbi:MAG: YdcF family protein [Nitrospirae bacterium]|nr:YdcF family protein [Nitrospirota bacterium]
MDFFSLIIEAAIGQRQTLKEPRTSRMMSNLYRKIRALLALLGLVVTGAVAAASLGVPEDAQLWLAGAAESTSEANYILLLPCGGVPSSCMLMRAHKAAEEHARNPKARIVVSHKVDGPFETSSLRQIRDELVFRGVPADAILLETKARSTAEHAKYIKEAGFGDIGKDRYLIVTSPTHIRRSVMVFRAAGFKHIYAAPAFDVYGSEDLGAGLFLRYGLWGSLALEIEVVRELIAIGWYKATGRA